MVCFIRWVTNIVLTEWSEKNSVYAHCHYFMFFVYVQSGEFTCYWIAHHIFNTTRLWGRVFLTTLKQRKMEACFSEYCSNSNTGLMQRPIDADMLFVEVLLCGSAPLPVELLESLVNRQG